jgi:hypothetical protein
MHSASHRSFTEEDLVLDIRVRIYKNPWGDVIPRDKLVDIIKKIALERALHIHTQFEAGNYKRNSIAIVLFDPSAAIKQPSSETMLCSIVIGPEGEQFLENAIAKGMMHRNSGQVAGYGRYVDPMMMMEGDFLYGFSTQVDSLIAGASGLTELQDACEGGHFAVSFNYMIRVAIKGWLDYYVKRKWLSNDDLPRHIYTDMAHRAANVWDSGAYWGTEIQLNVAASEPPL